MANVLGVTPEEVIDRVISLIPDYSSLSPAAVGMLRSSISTDKDEAVVRFSEWITDDRSEYFVHFSVAIAAAYKALQSHLTPSTSFDIVRRAVTDPFKASTKSWIHRRFDIDPDHPAGSYALIRRNFKSRGEQVVGDSFCYDLVEDTDDHHFVHISRCFFFNFFRALGFPELVPIVCEGDDFWATELNSGPYGVRFEKTGSLPQGDSVCRFHFWNTESTPGDVT